MTEKKSIIILGSTGSIGTQALEVVDAHPDHFEIYALTANQNTDLLIQQAKKFQPNSVVIVDESQYQKVNDALWEDDIKVYAGAQSLNEIVTASEVKIVLTGMVGFSGVDPTISALKYGKTIALANKETLVAAGEIISETALKKGGKIIPVDSEHSAIFQCLIGEFDNPIDKIILTASGGPFHGFTKDQLKSVTKSQALKHPKWNMGMKITIDSASMMNKGLEVIEASWLFDLKPEQIDIRVHPESIVHSMVQFRDGVIKAQMGIQDMKIPIQFALSYPERISNDLPKLDFDKWTQLNFEKPDFDLFKNPLLAIESLKMGGSAPCALNAANEVAVQAFLNDQISFIQISEINEKILLSHQPKKKPNLEELKEIHAETSRRTLELI